MAASSSGTLSGSEGVEGRDHQILGEGAGAVDADAYGVAAQVGAARQLRQWPQVMWPSPDTRSPTAKPRTSWPMATTSPTYSWPTTMGTGMVFCDHSSQL